MGKGEGTKGRTGGRETEREGDGDRGQGDREGVKGG